ncbi:MAG: UDP-N-acetylglucosamine 2-epimerase (hydrolyzing) [Phycisphaerales bacterium]|nr:UDP-N-acetylglucosamine 2-epimerase (hydrolyzing) [Phycisphaerales bacterium]
MPTTRKICFVTGSRADFGLMRPVLQAITNNARLKLQLVATGMHLQAAYGRSIDTIRAEGWKIDAAVEWKGGNGQPAQLAQATGAAMAGLALALKRLQSDVVLVVGDRVEAFAAASAGYISGKIVAHVHGGDRAMGQVDDALRHAITKLAHVHFPATHASALRLRRLGECADRIIQAGSPGVDGIEAAAATAEELLLHVPIAGRRRYALLILHPVEADEKKEKQRAELILAAVHSGGIERAVIVYPNNDPGSAGIIKAWQRVNDIQTAVFRDIPRRLFLALMRDAAVMVGNSSAGIIEAASFGTPVIDVGPRQQGRQRSKNVVQVDYNGSLIQQAVARIWNQGRPRRFNGVNCYGSSGAGQRISDYLASADFDLIQRHKIITY